MYSCIFVFTVIFNFKKVQIFFSLIRFVMAVRVVTHSCPKRDKTTLDTVTLKTRKFNSPSENFLADYLSKFKTTMDLIKLITSYKIL